MVPVFSFKFNRIKQHPLKHTEVYHPSDGNNEHNLQNEHHITLNKTWSYHLIPQTHHERVYWMHKSSVKWVIFPQSSIE